ncbi:hypothetical protein KY342_00445 [Candidatus Woesearchaeota archaeon]|nr:hypothetical protein [Candidatus Woesearchaeota archaeon]
MRKEILIGMIVLLIICSGCDLIRRDTGKAEPRKVEYHKGTEGLVLSLLKGNPPEKIWKESEFLIGVELRNKGAYDIEEAVIKLHGFNPRYVVPSESEERIGILHGRSPGYPEGDYFVVEFKETNLFSPPGKEALSFTFSAEYDYKTEASAVVCISPELNPLIKTKEKICEIKEISLSGGQGAPVAVTAVNEIPGYKSGRLNLKFIIDIENKGKGEVLGNITVEEVKLSNQIIQCDQSTLNLEKKKARIKCEIDLDKPEGPYESVLITKLAYRYKTKLDEKIEVIS